MCLGTVTTRNQHEHRLQSGGGLPLAHTVCLFMVPFCWAATALGQASSPASQPATSSSQPDSDSPVIVVYEHRPIGAPPEKSPAPYPELAIWGDGAIWIQHGPTEEVMTAHVSGEAVMTLLADLRLGDFWNVYLPRSVSGRKREISISVADQGEERSLHWDRVDDVDGAPFKYKQSQRVMIHAWKEARALIERRIPRPTGPMGATERRRRLAEIEAFMADDVPRQVTQMAKLGWLPRGFFEMNDFCMLAAEDIRVQFPQDPLVVRDGRVACEVRITNVSGVTKAIAVFTRGSSSVIVTPEGVRGWNLVFMVDCVWPSRDRVDKIRYIKPGASETVALSADVGSDPPKSVTIQIVGYNPLWEGEGGLLASRKFEVRAAPKPPASAPVQEPDRPAVRSEAGASAKKK